MQRLGAEHVMVVHSRDGLDEISLAQSTAISELKDGHIRDWVLNPEDYGISSQSLMGLVVEDAAQSLALIRNALGPRSTPAAAKAADLIALNAGAALSVSGLTRTLQQGIDLAVDLIHGGQALEKMSVLAEFTQHLKSAVPTAQS
jgi:anthranilate phosphoribosyltransferase